MAKTDGKRRRWTNEAVLGLLEEFPGLDDAEEAVRLKARELVADARKLGWPGPPFDPDLLASLRGIKLVEGPASLDHDALIRPRRDGTLEIVWNSSKPPTRRRYSICHEIAHTFFPDAYDLVHYRGGSHDPEQEIERLCDIAAAELLLPLDEFKRDLKALGLSLDAMNKLRERYDASREAVLLRMAFAATKPLAIAVLSWRHKPKEERDLAQSRFDFIDAPPRRLRVDFMAVSAKFRGTALPKHKSIPDESALYQLTEVGAPPLVTTVETWSTDRSDLPRCSVEGCNIPPGPEDVYRVAVVLRPA